MKLTLTITSGSLAGRSYDLETGFMTVGRSENCTVRFDPMNERLVSKQHCFIEARPDGYYITDNNSSNGTFLNGERVQQTMLKSGDRIEFGRNGSAATVHIDGAAFDEPPESIRLNQLAEYSSAAIHAPVNLQNSVANIGLGQIAVAPSEKKVGKYLGVALTIFTMVFLSLIVVVIMFLSVGIIPAIIAAVVAFIPAVIYLIPLMILDRYDPEPVWLLALAFAWGALVAVVVSFVLNTFFGIAVASTVSLDAGQFVSAVISAPIVEEASKGIGLLILLFAFRKYFDDILDGIVFAGVIALGFATVENVLYYGRALGSGGLAALVVIFVMRGVLSPFAHVTFTSITGIGCGIARESHNTFVKLLMPFLGYCGAVALHMLWNMMATLGGFGGFLLGYFIIELPFFLIFIGFAGYIMYRQNKILKEMLALDIARGLIPQEHAKTATSVFKSTGWLLSGLFSGKFRARSRYMRAIGSLGLSYWHIQRATAAQGQTASFQQNPLLREEVLAWRDKV
jgi:RsiW-degrading membrane proteinase PrsW (M82 family)